MTASAMTTSAMAPAQPELVIDVRGLCKRFGDNVVVDGLSLALAKGEICGFLGANGSGKTTILRMLCGLLKADAGRGHMPGLRHHARRPAHPPERGLHDPALQLL